MQTFKAFLEARDPSQPALQYEELTAKKAAEILKAHGSGSIDDLINGTGTLLYRGIRRNKYEFSLVDTSTSGRISQNTSNWYTAIFDSSPLMAAFPKRSKSLICTTEKNYVGGFGRPFVLVPLDGAKIGCTGKDDIWDVRIQEFNRSLESMNYMLSDLNRKFKLSDDKPITASTLKEIDHKLKNLDDETAQSVQYFFEHSIDQYYVGSGLDKKLQTDFLNTLYKLYDPEKLGFTADVAAAGKKLKLERGECWVEGKILVLAQSDLKSVLHELEGLEN
jgi:hypothetical protein